MTLHVSVCIPVHNGAEHVAETVQSVLAQTHADLDLVVVDNASTDATPGLLAQFTDSRMRVVRHETLLPVVQNWNRALSHARGEAIKLVCADDLLAPTCLELQVAALERGGEDVVLVSSRRTIVDSQGRVLLRRRGLGQLQGRVAGVEAVRTCVRAGTNLLGEPAAVLFRRSALERTDGFDPRLAYVVDVDLWFRMLATGDLLAQPQELAAFRVHAGSWSASLAHEQSRQVRQLLDTAFARFPEISAQDVRTGVRAARRQALARRVLYRGLRNRMAVAALAAATRRVDDRAV